MEDWPEALECKLRTIDEDSGSKEHHVTSENIQPIFSFLSRTKDDVGRSRILLQIFKFWRCLSLPIQPLEAFLVENSDAMMASIIPIFNHPEMLELEFSSALRLKVAAHILSMNKEGQEEGQIPHERLWTEICHNLEKDMEVRTKVVVPLVTASALTAESTTPSETEVVAFTCGHCYQRRRLQTQILREFQEKMESIPNSRQATSVMATDYRNTFISQACPVCVYNRLRQEIGSPAMSAWLA